MTKTSSKLLLAVLFVSSVGISYLAVTDWQFRGGPPPQTERPPTGTEADAAYNPFASVNGRNLVAVIVTASDCGWSSRPELMAKIGRVRTMLVGIHGPTYASVKTVGVSLDDDVDVGLAFMTKVANGQLSSAFDQVVVGGSWLNEQAIKLLWRGPRIAPLIPQIILMERVVDSTSYVADSTLKIGDDVVIAVINGNKEILGWIDSGLPLAAQRAVSESRQ